MGQPLTLRGRLWAWLAGMRRLVGTAGPFLQADPDEARGACHSSPSSIRLRLSAAGSIILLLLAALQGVALTDNLSSVNLIANGSFDTPGRRRLRWPTGGRR